MALSSSRPYPQCCDSTLPNTKTHLVCTWPLTVSLSLLLLSDKEQKDKEVSKESSEASVKDNTGGAEELPPKEVRKEKKESSKEKKESKKESSKESKEEVKKEAKKDKKEKDKNKEGKETEDKKVSKKSSVKAKEKESEAGDG